MPTGLSDWLDYIQSLHSREIDLSLDRVAEVFKRLLPDGVKFRVFAIAGTNGKGSTAELIASIYREGGYRVGKYSSPHISKFNERFNINGVDIGDRLLLLSFERVEKARAKTRLTFFEFGTLIAIDLFEKAAVDIAVMEVGLGGRLDATNILAADVAVVTSISIDHTTWLGDSLEEIAREKIGIADAGHPCVLGMAVPPQSIIDYCLQLGITPLIYGKQFSAVTNPSVSTWQWRSANRVFDSLPLAFAQPGHQITNAAVAVQAVVALEAVLPISDKAVQVGISKANLAGRCQLVARSPWIILDVAHNVDSVAGLLRFVQGLPITGRVYAVCGMLRDKQIVQTLVQLLDTVDEWHFATIDKPRGASAAQINLLLLNYLADLREPNKNKTSLLSFLHETATEAYTAARHKLHSDDCLIVFGSFYIVSDIIDLV